MLNPFISRTNSRLIYDEKANGSDLVYFSTVLRTKLKASLAFLSNVCRMNKKLWFLAVTEKFYPYFLPLESMNL